MELRRKRVYAPAESDDGYRVLVDRLWPRGISKERAAIGLWAKDVAPSPELRRAWHAAADADWERYADAYRAELSGPSSPALSSLAAELATHAVVTLVYAAHDEQHNHVVVLQELLRAAVDDEPA